MGNANDAAVRRVSEHRRDLTTQALGFMVDHAHVEFDKGVLLIAFVDGFVIPLEARGTVRAPDIKKALIVAVTVYDEIIAEWERMQQ